MRCCAVCKNRRVCDQKMLLLLMKMALILILSLIVFVPYADSQVSANVDKIPIGKS